MATWLDILAQNHTDAQGRFNPFSLIRGFSKSGRSEIDQNRQLQDAQRSFGITQLSEQGKTLPFLEELRRAEAGAGTKSIGRREAAIANIGGNADATPTDPESADVIQSLLAIRGTRQNQQIAGEANSRANASEGRTAAEFNAKRPYLEPLAKGSLDALQEGIKTSAQNRGLAQDEATINSMLKGEQLKGLRAQRERGAMLDPRLGQLLDAADIGSRTGDPALSRALLEFASQYLGDKGGEFRSMLQPKEDPQKAGARASLYKILSESAGGSSPASQGNNAPQASTVRSAPQVEQAINGGFGYSGGSTGDLLKTLMTAGSKVGQAGEDVLGSGKRSLEQILEMIRQINSNPNQ